MTNDSKTVFGKQETLLSVSVPELSALCASARCVKHTQGWKP
jgi:hypothetical protein